MPGNRLLKHITMKIYYSFSHTAGSRFINNRKSCSKAFTFERCNKLSCEKRERAKTQPLARSEINPKRIR